MNDFDKWIDNLDDTEIRTLSKGLETGLIKPRETREANILSSIEREGGVPANHTGVFHSAAVRWLAAAALLLCAIGTGLFFIAGLTHRAEGFVRLTSGTPHLEGTTGSVSLSPGMIVKEGLTLATEEEESCGIQVNDYAILRLEQNSRLAIRLLRSSTFSLELHSGAILVKTKGLEPDGYCEIITPAGRIRFGSTLFVSTTGGSVFTALYEGKARIFQKTSDGSEAAVSLSPGQSITIEENLPAAKDGIPDIIAKQLASFAEAPMLYKKNGAVTLSVTTPARNAALLVDGRQIGTFSIEISLSLPPGRHTIGIIKEGYEESLNEIELLPGRPLSVNIQLIEKIPAIPSELKSRVIYEYADPGAPGKNEILGFASSDDRIVAVTRTSLVCFDPGGSLVWERRFGIKKGIIFDSLPVIVNRKVYLSSNDDLLSFDIGTGEATRHEAPGFMVDGSGFSRSEATLYMPYADGIYRFDTGINIHTSLPFITINNPLPPLVTEKGFYITSAISPELVCAGGNGAIEHRYRLDAVCTCTPVRVNDAVIAGDRSGKLYSFSDRLELIRSLKLENGITSLCAAENALIAAVTENGYLSFIEAPSLLVSQTYPVDKTPDPGIYYYKKPVLIEKNIYIGSTEGKVLSFDGETGRLRNETDVSGRPISCSIYRLKNVLFTGTKKGEILLLY